MCRRTAGPYEADHRFYPPVRADGPHDAVTVRHWLALAADVGLPERAAGRIIDKVVAGVTALLPAATRGIDLPARALTDLQRRIRQRLRNLTSG